MLLQILYLILTCLVHTFNCWGFNDVRYNPKWGRTEESKQLASGEMSDNDIDANEDLTDNNSVQPNERIHLIFPGTKWCGPGNVASSYDDLGPETETDKCCRDHDNCPDVMIAGETKYNLTNNSYFTRLICECDTQFYHCLHNANTKSSNQVGVLYFDGIDQKCYREDYPAVRCKRKGGFFYRKCLDHEYDTSRERKYQFFDVQLY